MLPGSRWPTSSAHTCKPLPVAIGLFRDIDSAITLRFLIRFPSQDKADWLSPARRGNWLRSVSYNHLANLDQLWDHLHHAPAGTTGPQAAARADITLALVAALTALRTQIKALEDQIANQVAAPPDATIFTSLPRSGTVRAARLLAEIGDARGRFPTPKGWPAWPAQHPQPAGTTPERCCGCGLRLRCVAGLLPCCAHRVPRPRCPRRARTAGQGSRPRPRPRLTKAQITAALWRANRRGIDAKAGQIQQTLCADQLHRSAAVQSAML